MRKTRIIGRPGSSYHVISRFVDRQFALGTTKAKRVFLDIMLRQTAFSGVKILTYCLMGNHFHILIRVPEAPDLPEAEVLRRLAHIWPEKRLDQFKQTLARYRDISVEGETLVERALDQQRRRMYSLPEFVKDIKQRFATWYNHTHERKGTLFEERYKSVLVESGRALRMMAAYIDLNPLRAGLVDDPVDYPWCGYAQAMGGHEARQQGLRTVMTDPRDCRTHPWNQVARRYRLWIVERGVETKQRDGREKKKGFTRADAIAAWQSEGSVPAAKLLRCKARHLTDSLIYGSRAFVESEIETHRDQVGPYAKPRPASPVDDGGHPEQDFCGAVNFRFPAVG